MESIFFFQIFCYLIVAPLNHVANLCILFQMWTFKSSEAHWRHCLNHKPEMHSQSWLVIITSSRFVLITMLPGPLSVINSWLSYKHVHCTDFLREQSFPMECCSKARAHCIPYIWFSSRLWISQTMSTWVSYTISLSVGLLFWKVRLVIHDYLIASLSC